MVIAAASIYVLSDASLISGTPMTERNFPASFWDQNHNMTTSSQNAASSAATATSVAAAAMGRSYADFYGTADPLQAATGRN